VYVQFINFRVKIGDTMPTSFSSARPQRLGLFVFCLLALSLLAAVRCRPADAQAPPGPPTSLSAQPHYISPNNLDGYYAGQQVLLQWKPPAAAGYFYYLLECKTGANGTWATLDTASAQYPFYHNYYLPASTTFVYRVRTVQVSYTPGVANSTSAPSGEVSVTTLAAPPPVPPVPSGLTATPGNGQITLNWTGSVQASYYLVSIYAPDDDGSNAHLSVAAPPSGTAVSVTVTGLTNGAGYGFAVQAATQDPANATESGLIYSAVSSTVFATPVATPTSPNVSDLSTYATGSGKVTLYWTALNGASGYNVYRGTTTGGEDYNHPVNGASPVNAASYSGSPMDMYSDTGLVNGTQYFYTVKAVYGSTQSAASNEDGDVPDPAAVPWDTRNPGAIISAFGSAFASDTSGIGADPFSLRVVGPDNTIYDPSFSTAQPPDGSVTPGTNQFVGADGSTQALPDDAGELDPTTVSASGSQPNLVGTPLMGDKGPFRRVRTRGNANGSGDYRGATGTFYLPGATVTQASVTDHGDSPVIYLGISGSSIAVDAGLAYQRKSGTWALEMQVAGKIVSAQGNPAKTIQPTVLENIPGVGNAQYQRFTPSSFVSMNYWAWGTYPTTGRAKLSLLIVDDFDNSTAAALGAPSKYLNREENVRVKRVHAGVFPTGTTVNAASWSQGSVFLPGAAGSSQGWSSSDGTLPGEDGSYEGGHSHVNAVETSPFIQEDSITITINPN